MTIAAPPGEEGMGMSLRNYSKLVSCVSPRASIVQASRDMKARGIGAVVVISDDHKPIGLLTDRDVTLRVVAEGKDPEKCTVEEIMTSGVVSLPQDASLEQATELMRDHGVRRIPIVDEKGCVTGLVALDDILLLVGIELGNVASAIFKELSTVEDKTGGKAARSSQMQSP
jgi:signal-transduction protein with cAMP-binding, CBS, and nucleotidyltransferase domain